VEHQRYDQGLDCVPIAFVDAIRTIGVQVGGPVPLHIVLEGNGARHPRGHVHLGFIYQVEQ